MNSCLCTTGKPDYMPRETIYPILAISEIYVFFQWPGHSLEATLQGVMPHTTAITDFLGANHLVQYLSALFKNKNNKKSPIYFFSRRKTVFIKTY